MARLNYYFLDYLYREIGLTQQDIKSVPESGRADDACAAIAEKGYVQEQLDDVSFEQLKYVASSLCDNPMIESRKDAIMYLVWVVALGIKEEVVKTGFGIELLISWEITSGPPKPWEVILDLSMIHISPEEFNKNAGS